MHNHPWRTAALLAPAVAFFFSFWLLPLASLIALPANGKQGWLTYFAAFTEARYFQSLLNTVVLSLSVTVLCLILAACTGFYLAHNKFKGRGLLLSLLPLPLSFPGVVVGFFIILLGGRQGWALDVVGWLGWQGSAFAYGFTGLFLGYLYFSLPRAILTYTAACEKLDTSLQEAAQLLGAKPWQVMLDVVLPSLGPATTACGAIVFATAMGAFGTAFTLSAKWDVLPLSIYSEFTNYANFATAAALSITLGLITWAVLCLCRPRGAVSVH